MATLASGSNNLTTYYAKRIIGDSNATTSATALLQTGTNITANLWILGNTAHTTYGIKYVYDSNSHDKLEAWGGGSAATAWVQLDNGNTYILGQVGIGYNPNTSGNDYKLYVNGTSYFNGAVTTSGSITNNGRYLYIYTETSTADNLDSYIRFAVKDTTTGQTQNKGWIRVFNTHSADNNGMNMVIYSAGNVFVGGGESPKNLYDTLTTSTSENLYATADGSIFLEAGANTIANRKGIQINTSGHILPVAAESANSNAQNIGASDYEWGTTYTRAIYARHYEASANFTSDYNMYYGYSRCTNHYFYRGTTGGGQAHVATINIGGITSNYNIGIAQTAGASGYGISLYGGTGYVLNYGLLFATTSYLGTAWGVTSDWATYFTMDGAKARGWVFRHADGTKAASINCNGVLGCNQIIMNTTTSSAATSQPTALSYGRLQAYGTLCINANTDNSGTEYVILTAGHGCSSSTADGFWVGSSTVGTNFQFHNGGVQGGSWISGTKNAAFRVTAATTASAGGYYQGWYSGKTPSGAWSWGVLSGYNDCYFCFGTDSNFNNGTNSTANIKFGSNGTVYSAVWNDYAEYRMSDEKEPGRVTAPNKFGIAQRTSKRLQANARIISDTFGIAIGETDKAKTPVGLVGRVLAYPYRSIEEYHVGDCVCSAPNGTVDIMTRDEIKEWPDRIIGFVNEIPNYDIWDGTLTLPGNGKTGTTINVKGRIWIDIK